MKRNLEKFSKARTQIVTVSADTADELEAYRRKSGVPFTMLSDPELEVIKKYGVLNASERGGIAVPTVFILDESGTIRYSKGQSTLFRIRTKTLLREIRKL